MKSYTSVMKIIYKPVGSLWHCAVCVAGSSCCLCPAARRAPWAASLCPPCRLSFVPGSALDSCPAPACCGPPVQTDAWPPGAPPSVYQWVFSGYIQAALYSFLASQRLPLWQFKCHCSLHCRVLHESKSISMWKGAEIKPSTSRNKMMW